jgi:flagellar basal-body rod protein FlgG
MERGLYIAAAGMVAEQVRQDQIANDLANSSTPGYKADRAAQSTFGDLLVANQLTGQTVGGIDFGPQVTDVRSDLEQGPLDQTDEPLDVALEGQGFLSVQTPTGIRFTRNGQLSVDAQGRLITQAGYPVLGAAGRELAVGSGSDPTIATDGTITVGGKTAGKLAVVSLANPVKIGDTLFAGQPGVPPKDTVVRQGYLEASGVNPARAMVDMIVSLRAYEASQRVIHAIDDTLGRGIASGGPVAG